MYNINEIIDKVFFKLKERLTEGLSQRLFHFCPISSMYSIAKTDCFKLSSIEKRESDAKMTSLPIDRNNRKQYQYYMCFSRTPSSLVGYVSMRRDKTGGIGWKQSLVRIEVDGDMLNSNYKGMPVNYFNDKNLKKINHYKFDSKGKKRDTVRGRYGNTYSTQMDVNYLDDKGNIGVKTLQRYNPHADDKLDPRGKKRTLPSIDYGVIDRNQMLEYEDRLFSNEQFIKNIKERHIIKRIDIYINNNLLGNNSIHSQDILFMTDEIINIFGDIVHIYNNFSSFENVNLVNSISGYQFKKQYLELSQDEYMKTYKNFNKNKIELTYGQLVTVIRYATILGFYGFGDNWEKLAFNNTLSILKDINVVITQEVKDKVLYYLNQIYEVGGRFFAIQSKNLKKELDDFPPYKLERYISGLEYIRKKQEQSYALRTGKHVNILTVKSNYC